VKRLTRQEWVKLVRRVDGGEPLAIVAKVAGVRPKTLTWWRWKLQATTRPRRAAKRRSRASRHVGPALLPVVVADAAEAKAHRRRLRLRVADASLVFSEGTPPHYVAALVRALRAC
jgi:hypothetical protein